MLVPFHDSELMISNMDCGVSPLEVIFHLVFASSPEDQQRLRLLHSKVDREFTSLRSITELLSRKAHSCQQLFRVFMFKEGDTVDRTSLFSFMRCVSSCACSNKLVFIIALMSDHAPFRPTHNALP